LASSRRNWPTGRGFERFYGFLGAETSQWYPELVYDSHPVDPPRSPEEGYHLTEDLTDKALEFIKDAKVLAPDKPYFLYYAPAGCWTTSKRPASARTRWSSSSPTTALAARAAPTDPSTRTSSPTASRTTSNRTSRCSTSSAGRRPTTTTPMAGRWRSTLRSRCG